MVLGSFLSHTDMQSGSPGFGGPESAIGLFCSGQIARRLGLPWRAGGGALTSSQLPDAQAAYEGLNTMLPAFLAGANFVMHTAGWLESGLVSSYEKFVVDLEIVRTLREEFTPLEVDEASLAYGAHQEVGHGGHFLGAAHTLERFRDCFYRPLLSSTENFERWARNGGKRQRRARDRRSGKRRSSATSSRRWTLRCASSSRSYVTRPPERAGRLRASESHGFGDLRDALDVLCRGERRLPVGLDAQVRHAEARPHARPRVARNRRRPPSSRARARCRAPRGAARRRRPPRTAASRTSRNSAVGLGAAPRRERISPEPQSTARRTAAGPLPPSQIGMSRIAGGLKPTSAKRSRPISALTWRSVQSRCMSGICASMRLPRVWKSSPSASYSSGFQPTPSAEPQAAAGEHVDLGRLLRRERGLALREDDDARHELDLPRARREEAEEHERLVERLGGVVVLADDVVERDDVGEAGVLGRLRRTRGSRPGRRRSRSAGG